MNYIYDILINYQGALYDVYEWNKEDDIIHIRKIPLVRFSSKILNEMVNNKIKLNTDFLERIYKRTELFNRNKIVTLDYGFLATDCSQAIAFKIDRSGYITHYSKLLIEEELEVLEYASNLKELVVEYQILNNINKMDYMTRKEILIRDYIFKELRQIIKKNNDELLEYLYLDCFDEKENINYINKNIFSDIEQKWDSVYQKVYNFLKLTTSKR